MRCRSLLFTPGNRLELLAKVERRNPDMVVADLEDAGIHPRQVALAHAAFTPGEAEVAAARSIVEAASNGVGVVDGMMVDAAHLRAAEQVLAQTIPETPGG